MSRRRRKSAMMIAARFWATIAHLWVMWLALLALIPLWFRALRLTHEPGWFVHRMFPPFYFTIFAAVGLACLCLPVTLMIARKKSRPQVSRGLLLTMTPVCLFLACIDMIKPEAVFITTGLAAIMFHVVMLTIISQLPNMVLFGNYPLCNECGYDLRGNTINSCPECGAGTYVPDETAKTILDDMIADGGLVGVELYEDGVYVLRGRFHGKKQVVSGSDLRLVAEALEEKRKTALALVGR